MNNEYKYDVALSFAGENREYVEDVAIFLKSFGVKVFYDKFEQADMWGKNLYDHLSDVYKNKAKYTIMFVSEAYKKSRWTNLERQLAQARAFNEHREYILPVKFDDTEIEGLNETVLYLDAKIHSPKEISKFFLEKSGFNTKKRWWGIWEAGKDRNWFEQDLFITRVDDNGFDFEIICIHGAHIGDMSGYAKFTSHNEALFESDDEYGDEVCKLIFYKINETIQVTENNCNDYHGMRAYFDGDYEFNRDVFTYDEYSELVDDVALSNIYKLIGRKYWDKFQRNFSDTHEGDDLDNLNVEVISGGVAGLYSIQESILMIDKDKKVWGAFIHDEDDKVYYFTSEKKYKNNLPKTIEDWRENFKEKEVRFITEEMINKEDNQEQKDRLIGEFVEFLSNKKENGNNIDMTEEELKDFFVRCVNSENE